MPSPKRNGPCFAKKIQKDFHRVRMKLWAVSICPASLQKGIVNLTLITTSKVTDWLKFTFFEDFSNPLRPSRLPIFESVWPSDFDNLLLSLDVFSVWNVRKSGQLGKNLEHDPLIWSAGTPSLAFVLVDAGFRPDCLALCAAGVQHRARPRGALLASFVIFLWW